ncbi:hypothetical protein TEA_001555 [Camellia sinensis var. sinensis]|uniref:Histidine kinase domain-containing protein n=1 Tax=Camellia sinensis var. sinensis TaxID=542762 RepID=A0A4S4D4L8_CAMSN|nr:hypothetical protein TEA_001555 [Camellia sinensis var. sinensis]
MASSSRPATQNLLTLFPELNEPTREITCAVASEPQLNTSGFAPLNFPMRSVEQKMAVPWKKNMRIGRHLDGRFLVICLEELRPYVGEFVTNDPQRRLDLLKPRLLGGESPPGFLGFAVNMINIDSANLHRLTANGLGLRETLFYNLFSRLQVYRTREDMLQALPYIRDGALSLDGGMVKTTGVFSLGNRPLSESNQAQKATGNSTTPTSDVMEDPFVVLESTSTHTVPSPGLFNDPLDEISKLGNSGSTKVSGSSVSGGVFDDIDPFDGFGKSVPACSTEMHNRVKDGSPSRTGSSMGRTQTSASSEGGAAAGGGVAGGGVGSEPRKRLEDRLFEAIVGGVFQQILINVSPESEEYMESSDDPPRGSALVLPSAVPEDSLLTATATETLAACAELGPEPEQVEQQPVVEWLVEESEVNLGSDWRIVCLRPLLGAAAEPGASGHGNEADDAEVWRHPVFCGLDARDGGSAKALFTVSMELNVEEFILGNVIDTVVSQVMILLKEKKLQLVHEIPDEIKMLYLFGDQVRLQLVLSDFLLNIAHYAPSPNGWVEIKVSPGLKLIQDGNELVHLQFRMTHPGKGIPSAIIQDMFEGGNKWTTPEGLGLNLSRKLLSIMNGHIHYAREQDRCYFLIDLELRTKTSRQQQDTSRTT